VNKEELLKYLIAEIDLIMHDKDYRFENQDGTWYSRESCRDLTNEEVFEELRSELRQLADLEAKLAEKDKLIEFYINSGKEQCDEINKINHRSIIKADEIDQLKQQLAEKEKDKISFALEQLEKVKEKANEERNNGWCMSYASRYDILEYIDNQIKQLKEGK
jgi:hypothetical protein